MKTEARINPHWAGARSWMAIAVLVLAGLTARSEVRTPVFDADTYVSLPSTVTLSGDFTIEYWFKTERNTNWRFINNDANYNYSIAHPNASQIQVWSPDQTLTLNQSFGLKVWEHVAIVRLGADVSIYRNGALVGSGVWTGQVRLNQIGGSPANSGWGKYEGQAAELRLWDHARGIFDIQNQRLWRLTGGEAGLVGYWRLDEGSGDTAHDLSPAGNHGTISNAVWDAAGQLDLSDFVVEHPVTGSRRFTGTNTLAVALFRRYAGYTHWQVTEGNAAPNPDAEFWNVTSAPPTTVTFTRPGVDTNVTLTAWYTNLSAQVALLSNRTSIAYTTVPPLPAARTSLSRELAPGSVVVVNPKDIDTGSTGGTSQGKALAIYSSSVTVLNGADEDASPNDPWITVSKLGAYTLGLSLMNEAGNVADAAQTCALTVTSFSGAFRWSGASDNDWFNPLNWLPNGVPDTGQDVTIGSGMVTLTNATAALGSLIVSNGATLTVSGWESALQATQMSIAGTITHAINDVATTNSLGEWVPQHRILIAGSNITLAATGVLDANSKGYRKMQGPGSTLAAAGGAGHAGEGGFSHVSGGPGGTGYGDPAEPTQLGSGGGSATYGSEGGGAVRIDASGRVVVDGKILADAPKGVGTYGSGGSGGSIWIACRTLAGAASGRLSVKGGDGIYWGGGGSGGRIAIDYNTVAQADESLPAICFDGTPGIQPTSAKRADSNWETFRAWMGSLHLPDTRLIDGDLSAKRLQWVQVYIPNWDCWERDTLTLNDCVIGLAEGVGVNVTNDLSVTNGAALHVHAAPVADVLTEYGLEVHVGGDAHVHAASWILPYAQPTNGAVVRFTVNGNLTVAAGGGFDADRRGYTRYAGYNTILSGAGHGGHSGMGFDGTGWSEPYGDLVYPVQAGSGGPNKTSGRGGGAILLIVTGDAVLHGKLIADGGCGMRSNGHGGSGGSILLVCRTVQGGNSALLSVDGGQGDGNSGSGGGGRIAIHYDTVAQTALAEPVPPIRFSAFAASNTTVNVYRINAQEGTLWLPDNLWLTDRLDQGRFRNLQIFTPDLNAWAPASLTLDNCILTLPEGYNLSVASDLVLTNGAGLYLSAAPTNTTDARYGAELRVERDLRLCAQSWVYPQAHTNDGAIVGIRVGRDVMIEAGGGIDATGRGYQGAAGVFVGAGAGRASGAGGGYGGTGGVYSGLATTAGRAYGLACLPLQPGSPAGWRGRNGGYGVGGGGGGAIHLLAGGQVKLDGTLIADGWDGVYWSGSGGSGGAIFVAARRVTGSGRLSVQGGGAIGDGASGGGGRIAVWYGMGFDEIDRRIDQNMVSDLKWHSPETWFSGAIDLGWRGGGLTPAFLPTAGSVGFYSRSGTIMLIR